MATTRSGYASHAASRRAVESAPPLNATATSPVMGGSGRHGLFDASGVAVVEAAIALQPLVPSVQQLRWLEVTDLTQGVSECTLQCRSHLFVVTVGTAHRLIDDFVNQTQRFEARRNDAQRFCSDFCFSSVRRSY